jgi:hypothetical protein
MTSVIRYVKNTTTATNVNTNVGSTGGDYQLIAIDVTTVAGIFANGTANVLTWTGSGQIKSILSVFIKSNVGAINVPAAAGTTRVTIDESGKIVNVAVAAGGTAIAANSVISLLLVIGNY